MSPNLPHRHAHFIGIAGIGMSAVALLLRQTGWTVSGSDEGFYPPASEILPAHGITVSTPHSPANIPAGTTLFVIGKHAKLTMENPEVAAAHRSGIKVASYPEVLAELLQHRKNLVVAGSYGKSTTTSLLTWALLESHQFPGYFIGALPKNLKSNSNLGEDDTFVMEGDEYPSSNTDPRAKFLHYPAQSVLLTSVVHDHVNIFPTQESYEVPFVQLLEKLPHNGLLVACADEPHAKRLSNKARCKVVTYGVENPRADYNASNITYGETTRFTLTANGKNLGEFTTTQLGTHNIQNMAGAAALLLEQKLTTADALRKAFASFAGVVRRLDKVTTTSAIPAYEGFGSSREKALAAIHAIRLHFPNHRLAIAFEPHTFSWRNRDALPWYDDVFAEAAEVFLYHPPQHGSGTHSQLNQDEIAARITASGKTKVTKLAENSPPEPVLNALKNGDVLLILTSGQMGGMLPALVKGLDARFSPKNAA